MARDRMCCMCPAQGSNFKETDCIKGTHIMGFDVNNDCDFVVKFQDEHGWIYFVRGGLGKIAIIHS